MSFMERVPHPRRLTRMRHPKRHPIAPMAPQLRRCGPFQLPARVLPRLGSEIREDTLVLLQPNFICTLILSATAPSFCLHP